jgi:hypothetical protein
VRPGSCSSSAPRLTPHSNSLGRSWLLSSVTAEGLIWNGYKQRTPQVPVVHSTIIIDNAEAKRRGISKPSLVDRACAGRLQRANQRWGAHPCGWGRYERSVLQHLPKPTGYRVHWKDPNSTKLKVVTANKLSSFPDRLHSSAVCTNQKTVFASLL